LLVYAAVDNVIEQKNDTKNYKIFKMYTVQNYKLSKTKQVY